MNYLEQLNYIKAHGLSEKSSRQDCPFCGGHNTFSITRDNGLLQWNCFRASCTARGTYKATRSPSEIRAALGMSQGVQAPRFELPDRLVSPLSRDEVYQYLRRNHCLQAYQNRLADIRYDPRLNRVVFVIRDSDGQPVDAAGRALNRDQKPKWLRYGDSGLPFICGTSDTAVVLEDAASACAVASIATGFALLGSTVSYSHLHKLRAFKQVVIALDKDASRKSIELHRRLASLNNVSVRLLEDDLKYLEPDEIRTVLRLNDLRGSNEAPSHHPSGL